MHNLTQFLAKCMKKMHARESSRNVSNKKGYQTRERDLQNNEDDNDVNHAFHVNLEFLQCLGMISDKGKNDTWGGCTRGSSLVTEHCGQ